MCGLGWMCSFALRSAKTTGVERGDVVPRGLRASVQPQALKEAVPATHEAIWMVEVCQAHARAVGRQTMVRARPAACPGVPHAHGIQFPAMALGRVGGDVIGGDGRCAPAPENMLASR